jgi:hypothetical protein
MVAYRDASAKLAVLLEPEDAEARNRVNAEKNFQMAEVKRPVCQEEPKANV